MEEQPSTPACMSLSTAEPVRDSLLLRHCRDRANAIIQLISQRLLHQCPHLIHLRLTHSSFSDFLALVEADTSLLIGTLELDNVESCTGAEMLWTHVRSVTALHIRSGSCLQQLLQSLYVIEKGTDWALGDLRELRIEAVPLATDSRSVSRLLKRVGGLSILHLRQCCIDYYFSDELIDALGRLSALRNLSLSDNPLGDSGLIVLSIALEQLTELREVDLSACRIGKAGLAALLSRIPAAVETLNLSSNALSGEALQPLSDFASRLRHIQRLNLSGNDLGPEGCSALSDFLRTVDSLLELSSNCNYIGAAGFRFVLSALAGRHLARQGQASVKTLEVSTNDITAAALAAFTPQLQQLYELERLDLSTNHFGPEGAAAMSKSLLFLPNLVSLNLSENAIKDSGALSLSKSMKFLLSLRDLNLASNGLTKKGFLALLSALPLSPRISQLSFACNPISDSSIPPAISHLVTMDELLSFDIRGTKLTPKSIKLLRTLRGSLAVLWD